MTRVTQRRRGARVSTGGREETQRVSVEGPRVGDVALGVTPLLGPLRENLPGLRGDSLREHVSSVY